MGLKTQFREYTAHGEIIESGSCDGCGLTLNVDPFDNNGQEALREDWSNLDVVDGIRLTLHGGYQALFDSSSINALLCRSCTRKLLDLLPQLEYLILSADQYSGQFTETRLRELLAAKEISAV